jgi:predicted dehydrogenase
MDAGERKLRLGMVGAGRGIGLAHRVAALMDNQADLVGGCFSRDYDRCRALGRELFVPAERCYRSYEEMADAEAALPADRRIDVVSVVVRNSLHFPVSKTFLEHGFHVICDKPLTCTLDDAKALVRLVERTGLVFCLTHNYTGNLLVRQARHMLTSGEMGELSRFIVEYLQGGDRIVLERRPEPKRWLDDPEQVGVGGTIADIGTHALNLLEYVTGDRVVELACDRTDLAGHSLVPRDAAMLLRMSSGAKGTLTCSQMAPGESNALNLRLYATGGSLEWHQNRPEVMRVTRKGIQDQIVWRGRDMAEPVQKLVRAWPAHPEGFLEAFGNVYLGAYEAIRAHIAGRPMKAEDYNCPTVYDGLRGMQFVYAAIESFENGSTWVPLER